MSNASIFCAVNETLITEGLQSAVRCDEAIQAARRIAASRCRSVLVEDYGTRETYIIRPNGTRLNVGAEP